jgi:delta1-piperideine-2-carboxylate reductase
MSVTGLRSESALATANVITAAEADGCKSHGLFRLPHYCAGLTLGKCSGTSMPVVHDRAPGGVQVRATEQSAYPPVHSTRCIPPVASDQHSIA